MVFLLFVPPPVIEFRISQPTLVLEYWSSDQVPDQEPLALAVVSGKDERFGEPVGAKKSHQIGNMMSPRTMATHDKKASKVTHAGLKNLSVA